MRHLLSALLVLSACAAAQPVSINDDAGVETSDAGTSAALDAGGADAASGDPCLKPGVQKIVSLRFDPSAISLVKGGVGRFAVNGTFDSGCTRNVTGSLTFTVGTPSVARVLDAEPDVDSSLPGKALEALARGTTTLTAASGALTSDTLTLTVTEDTVVVPPPKTETRAVWVTRFAYSGLPAAAGTAAVKRIVNAAADSGFNAVFLQIRGTGDAYYKSALVPWWEGGGRQLGADPGWDPLQVGIDAAHARGLELHAYFNAFSAWPKSGTTPATIPDSVAGAPRHALRAHPEWTCLDAGNADTAPEYTWAAADPAYRAHLVAVVDELLTRYDVDGIHLDRIRTPGSTFCHTAALDDLFTRTYGADKSKWQDFQRDQITATVEGIYNKIVAKKPKVKLSAAVWGIYKRLPGCSTSEGFSNYYQDSLGWMKKGVIDALCPMIYWDIKAGSCTDWATLLDGFVAGASGRQIIAGMHALEGSAPNFSRVAGRINYGRKKQVAGEIVFASAYLDQYTLWDDYRAGPYPDTLPTTPMTHR